MMRSSGAQLQESNVKGPISVLWPLITAVCALPTGPRRFELRLFEPKSNVLPLHHGPRVANRGNYIRVNRPVPDNRTTMPARAFDATHGRNDTPSINPGDLMRGSRFGPPPDADRRRAKLAAAKSPRREQPSAATDC